MPFTTTAFLHGGDYNPEQWQAYPGVLAEDLRMMPLAHVNTLSIGIFAWSTLEPEEHVYRFEWLDQTFDRLHGIGMRIILSTPGGARPPWMAQKYPEVMRMGQDRKRPLFGLRHNHCPSSPVYRDKCAEINGLLAERYGQHPALVLWHVNNEYLGSCYCPLCETAFRAWLQRRYGTLDALNAAWWSDFWSMRFNDWSQIEAPAEHGQSTFNALRIDYQRFMSDQVIHFFKAESAPLRRISPHVPVTANFHRGGFLDYNCWNFARELDVVSWDNYPFWHQDRTLPLQPLTAGAKEVEDGTELTVQSEYHTAIEAAFLFDMMRSLKGGQPFLMMESTPGMAQWFLHPAQKERGLPLLSALQAVAHGSQSVLYFQWRKSRGNFEKFHGAVVDHVGHEHTRVFREVTETGRLLEAIQPIVTSAPRAEIALMYDCDTALALAEINGLHNVLLCRNPSGYLRLVEEYYRALVEQGITVDFISPAHDPSIYKVVVAPAWYMVSEAAGRRITDYVRQGGVFLATYWTGVVNENDQCHLGGFPGPLREALGVWAEEWSTLAEHRSAVVEFVDGFLTGIGREATIRTIEEGLHLQGAEALARFTKGLYVGQPAVTRNRFERGTAYYLGAKLPHPHLKALLGRVLDDACVKPVHDFTVPSGVYVTRRCAPDRDSLFVMNFRATAQEVDLGRGACLRLPERVPVAGRVTLPAFGLLVLEWVERGNL